MPYKDPEKRREYHRNYQRNRIVSDEEKKAKSEYQKNYMKSYQKPVYHKTETIGNWRRRGVIETWFYNYDELYDCYMKTKPNTSIRFNLAPVAFFPQKELQVYEHYALF